MLNPVHLAWTFLVPSTFSGKLRDFSPPYENFPTAMCTKRLIRFVLILMHIISYSHT